MQTMTDLANVVTDKKKIVTYALDKVLPSVCIRRFSACSNYTEAPIHMNDFPNIRK